MISFPQTLMHISFLIMVVEFIPLNDIIPSDTDAYEPSNNGLLLKFIPLNDIIPSDPDAYEISKIGLLLNLFH